MATAVIERRLGSGWRTLLTAVAGVQAVLLVALGAVAGDNEALALGVATAIGAVLLRVRRGLAGDIVLGLVCADVAAWLVPAAAGNIVHHDRLAAIVVPATFATVGLVGVASAVVHLVERRRRSPVVAVSPGAVGAGGLALLVATIAVAAIVGFGQSRHLPPGTALISAHNTAFSTKQLQAAAGDVTVAFTNHDLFWHTFTITGLGVNLKVPVDGHRQVTFRAPTGSYTYFCAIPGHRSAGMSGSLIVR